jgi:hypothetical protein
MSQRHLYARTKLIIAADNFEKPTNYRINTKSIKLPDIEEVRVSNCDMLERSLPTYLRDDINTFSEGERIHSSMLDCYYCSLQSSINSAEVDCEITEEQATHLRRKYLGYED